MNRSNFSFPNNIFSQLFGVGGPTNRNSYDDHLNPFNFNQNNQSNQNNQNNRNQNNRNQNNQNQGNFFFPNNNNGGNVGFSFSNNTNSSNTNPFNTSFFRGRMNNLNFVEDIFEPSFLSFGIGNQFFQDNYSSNFPSNFNINFRDIMEESFRQNQGNNKPPTSKEAIKKLKRFKMNEKYCKKGEDKSGTKLEQPSCCVCITEIKMNDDTLLIPCGHMFHNDCIMPWLSQNNTCPVCRFELPAEK